MSRDPNSAPPSHWPLVAGALALIGLLGLCGLAGHALLYRARPVAVPTPPADDPSPDKPPPREPSPQRATPEQMAALRRRTREKALAWIRDNNPFKPDSGFIRDCTSKIEHAQDDAGLVFTFGANLMREGRPTVLAVRGDGFFAFTVTEEQAQAWQLPRTGMHAVTHLERETRYIPPAFDLSNPVIDGAPSLSPQRRIEGSIVLRRNGTWHGKDVRLRIGVTLEQGIRYSIDVADLSGREGRVFFSAPSVTARGDMKTRGGVPVFFDLIEGPDGDSPTVASNTVACLAFVARDLK